MVNSISRLAVFAVALALLFPAAMLAGQGSNTALKVAAEGAMVYLDSCPEFPPAQPTMCTAIEVQYARHRVPEAGYEPWFASALIESVRIHPDASYEILDSVWGFTTLDVSGTYDKQHLSAASVVATIPMSDGSTLPVNLRWSGEGRKVVTGADGWFTDGRHFRDACTTQNYNENQRVRGASATGTIGDRSMAEVADDGFTVWESAIFNNWFHWIVATRGDCD